jgi:hypothetical protein
MRHSTKTNDRSRTGRIGKGPPYVKPEPRGGESTREPNLISSDQTSLSCSRDTAFNGGVNLVHRSGWRTDRPTPIMVMCPPINHAHLKAIKAHVYP